MTPRRALFTPTNTKGSPRADMLSSQRDTIYTFVGDDQEMQIEDHWDDPKRAHKVLDDPRHWTGATMFYEKGKEDGVVASVGPAVAGKPHHYPLTLASRPPRWSSVWRRVTRDIDKDAVIEDICDTDDRWTDYQHMTRNLRNAPLNISTTLYLKHMTPDAPSQQETLFPRVTGGLKNTSRPHQTTNNCWSNDATKRRPFQREPHQTRQGST